MSIIELPVVLCLPHPRSSLLPHACPQFESPPRPIPLFPFLGCHHPGRLPSPPGYSMESVVPPVSPWQRLPSQHGSENCSCPCSSLDPWFPPECDFVMQGTPGLPEDIFSCLLWECSWYLVGSQRCHSRTCNPWDGPHSRALPAAECISVKAERGQLLQRPWLLSPLFLMYIVTSTP